MSQLLLITGLSGAGKSTALKAVEDLGYETMDNVPLSLLPMLIVQEAVQDQLIVAGVDIRSRDFSAGYLGKAIEAIRKAGRHKVEILFLTCDDEVIQRRYTETRRKHPLAMDRPIADGITREREIIGEIQHWADKVIDTSHIKPTELRAMIHNQYAKPEATLSLFLQSFSFRVGVPRDADLVFDVRFLRNPHYVEELRPLTGQDTRIGDYIGQDEAFAPFFEHLTTLLLPLLPRYQQEGKSYLTIAIGCTGGKHRSVFVTEQLAGFLKEKGYNLQYRHRDMPQ